MSGVPALRPGADDGRPALTHDGRTWSYREFVAMVDAAAADLALDLAAPPRATTGLPLESALALVFGAAAAGVPVVVADPACPDLSIGPPGDSTFLIVVTSGTSGRPRPVLRTAASWTSSFAPLAELAGIAANDRVLLTGPLHATMHLFAAVHTLALGAELTDRPELASVVHAVPPVLADLLAMLPANASLRTAVLAGSSLPAAVADAAVARGIAVTEYYGAAELSFVAARRYPNAMRAFPGAEVQLRDDAVWVRSPYLALGYPAGVAGPYRSDADGFATVGDLADGLPDGGLLIRGRGDAAITTGGATVLAEDVESVLADLPGVAAVAIVGVPHDRLGQVVTAVIEPVPDADPSDLLGLRSAARAVLQNQSLPRRWLLTPRLPRTAGGKIARSQVRQAVTGHAAGQQPDAPPLPLGPLP